MTKTDESRDEQGQRERLAAYVAEHCPKHPNASRPTVEEHKQRIVREVAQGVAMPAMTDHWQAALSIGIKLHTMLADLVRAIEDDPKEALRGFYEKVRDKLDLDVLDALYPGLLFATTIDFILTGIDADSLTVERLSEYAGALTMLVEPVRSTAKTLGAAFLEMTDVFVMQLFLTTRDIKKELAEPQKEPAPASPDQTVADKPVIEIATSVPAWGGASILTQGADLEWEKDDDGGYRHTRNISSHGGFAHFWITNPGNEEDPRVLAFAAGQKMVQTFDPRSATMHWLYSQYSMRLDEPWRNEFVINGDEALDILGLAKRTDMTRSEKLLLLEKLAAQPSQILVFLYNPESPYSKKFTISRSRLWDIDFDYHGETVDGSRRELTGLTIYGRAGRWAKSFLNRKGKEDGSAFFEYGHVSLDVLKSIPRHYYHHRGATRLIVYLVHKFRVSPPGQPISVQTLMIEAYGEARVKAAGQSYKHRGLLADIFERDLAVLIDEGWTLDFDAGRFPHDIRPEFVAPRPAKGDKRPKGYWERLLAATLVVYPPQAMALKLADCSQRRIQRRRRGQRRTAVASGQSGYGATRV